MTEDEQEALSIKYSHMSMMLTKLSSGKFALFTRGFKLVKIGTWEELESHYNPIDENPYTSPSTISTDQLDLILKDLL